MSTRLFSLVVALLCTAAVLPVQAQNVIPQSKWSLLYADSQETGQENGSSINAFDGDPGTFWHTAWSNHAAPMPHEIWIDLGATYDLTALYYLPRQDGGINGRIGQYEVYASTDPTNWEAPVASGSWSNDASDKVARFSSKTARYVRLRALSDAGGTSYTSAAEINLAGAASLIYAQQASNDTSKVYYEFKYAGGPYSFYRVCIDTDRDPSTGFAFGGIGSDYLLEGDSLFKYSGQNGLWNWTQVKKVTHSHANSLARWTVARGDLGKGAPTNAADVLFQVESPLYSTAKYGQVFGGTSPLFTGIPYAVGLAVDDLGWKDGGTPETSWLGNRAPTLADYQTVINVGKNAGTRIMTAWILRDLDRSNILARPEYNQPIAPSDSTAEGLNWNNSARVNDDDFTQMNLIRDNAAHLEFGLHGTSHEHWANGIQARAEYANLLDPFRESYAALSWGRTDMTNKAAAFQDLMRQYYDADTSSFPRAFVPPAHAYYHGNDGTGSADSTGAVLSTFGVKYVNGDLAYSTKLGEGGIDHGVLAINRDFGAPWSWDGATPWANETAGKQYPYYPSAGYGWAEAHFPNLYGAEASWTTYLKGLNNSPDRMLGKNTAQISSQWLYRHYASISGSNGTYTINNGGMPADAYNYDLLGNLVLKTPLAPGQHIQSASIDGGARIVGYYEDTFGYAYLVIGHSTNAMGRLSKTAYTLSSSLGRGYMRAYVDMTASTFNVFSFQSTSASAALKLEMYGIQTVKVRLPFTPSSVSSSNPNLQIRNWSYNAPFLSMSVAGKNIQGEVGTITIQ